MEVDSIEMNFLQENAAEAKFRVLVATPEKFDLLIRQGWEEKIGRPLTTGKVITKLSANDRISGSGGEKVCLFTNSGQTDNSFGFVFAKNVM